MKCKVEAVVTKYWMPNDNYLEIIVDALRGRIDDGDIIAISEKAVSTAEKNMVDESGVKPGSLAKFLARYWMRIIWGYILGLICRLKAENIQRIRNYPVIEGSIHKQVVLRHAGILQALLWGSEGGIDASNMPYSYVSLPLRDPEKIAERIHQYIVNKLNKSVTVMIVDTDKTYSLGGFHFTPRPNPIKGIHSFGGIIAYIFGRSLKMKRRSTPLAIVGSEIEVDQALEFAEIAHRVRGSGAGLTVWDMSEIFGVPITQVTWSMLKGIKHKPIVIFRFMVKRESFNAYIGHDYIMN